LKVYKVSAKGGSQPKAPACRQAGTSPWLAQQPLAEKIKIKLQYIRLWFPIRS